ncbi:hypothetical protein TCAL_09431 [Tigriopus californicus]|uniref:Putative sodium-coupled neutral amino acid transporter 11 n=1 Tax=Tigriopus californicus TaxID=6832 RepID=A0A553PPC2_TIGCA|nr:hypothetical protein TCAL_09431 [Tigriopus californicus]
MSKKTLPFTHIMASKMEKGHRDNQDNVNLKGRDFGSTESEVCFNYINSIIGSGIIGIPYAFKATGIGLGVMVLCLAGGLVNLSLRLLMKAGEMSETKSYQELMCFSFGYPGFWVITFLQFAYPCTAMTTYNIIVGDTVTTILVRLTGWDPSHFLVRREFVILMITLVVTLPLSLYRNIGKLSKVSFLSLIFTAFVTVVIYVRIAPMMDIVKDQTQVLSWFDMSGFAEGVGILSLTFMCHHNSFLLFNSMANPSISKWNQVTNWSVGISMIVVLLLGFGGYVTFRGGTQGDVLNNYCWGDDLANVARLVFCVTVLFTYPIECFVCREVFENIITGFIGHFERTTGFHYLLTIILVALPCALSMGTSCLGIVLDLNGLGFALPLAYILPGICYLRVNNGSWYDWDNMVALMLATFGIGVTVIGISQLVFAGAEECIHDQELPYCAKSNFTHILPREAKSRVTEDSKLLDPDLLLDPINDRELKSNASTCFNYVNSILGSGIIGMAYAMEQSGIILGLSLITVVAVVVDWSLQVLLAAGLKIKAYSYQELVEQTLGRPGYWILTICQFGYPMIAMVSYNIVAGDTMTRVLTSVTGWPSSSLLLQREVIITALTMFFTIPLCFYRDHHENSWSLVDFSGVSTTYGVIIFAFLCHHNSFMMYYDMRVQNQDNWNKVTHVSVGLSWAACVLMGLMGDLLNNYCWDDPLMNIVKVLFCFTVLFTYPIECLVTREVVVNIFFKPEGDEPDLAKLGVVFGIPLATILPAMCYLKVADGSWYEKYRLASLTILILGSIAFVFGFNENGCLVDVEMPYCHFNGTS